MKSTLSLPIKYEVIESMERVNKIVNGVREKFSDTWVDISRTQENGPTMSPTILLDVDTTNVKDDVDIVDLKVKIVQYALELFYSDL